MPNTYWQHEDSPTGLFIVSEDMEPLSEDDGYTELKGKELKEFQATWDKRIKNSNGILDPLESPFYELPKDFTIEYGKNYDVSDDGKLTLAKDQGKEEELEDDRQ